MKYFTPDWWALNVKNTDAAVSDYWRYVDTIRPRLTPSLRTLLDEVSLHDSKVRRFHVDVSNRTVLMILHGFTDPWSPDGQTERRFELRYEGAISVESANEGGWVSEHLDDSDLGYCEIELLPNGYWEHRMLFASGVELAIRFQELSLKYEPLSEADSSVP